MRLTRLLLPLAASLALLVGCTPATPTASPTDTSNGVAELTADEILDKAAAALKSASSFTLSASTFNVGLFNINNLEIVYAGSDVSGSGSIAGVTFQIRKIGADVYLNADASLLGPALAAFAPGLDPSLITQFSQQWLKVPAPVVALVVPLPLDVQTIFTWVEEPLEKGEESTVDGVPVIVVKDAAGAEFSVATQGEPYLIQISLPTGPIGFDDFGAAVDPITAPEGAIDVMALVLG